jgi:polyisoprenoid-binding protein YceI
VGRRHRQPAEPEESLHDVSTFTTRTIVPTGTWVVDQARSKTGFAVNQLGIASVCGEFTEFQGTLQVAGELSSPVQIELEMETNI